MKRQTRRIDILVKPDAGPDAFDIAADRLSRYATELLKALISDGVNPDTATLVTNAEELPDGSTLLTTEFEVEVPFRRRFRRFARWLYGAPVVIAALAIALAGASSALATTLHQTPPIYPQDAQQDCSGVTVADGQVLWHFVLTDPPAGGTLMIATFGYPAHDYARLPDKTVGNVAHYVYTTSADAVLLNAYTLSDGAILNLSHVCMEVTPSATPTASTEPSVEPTPSTTPEASSTPEPTPTSTPSATTSPTPTSTPTPSATSSAPLPSATPSTSSAPSTRPLPTLAPTDTEPADSAPGQVNLFLLAFVIGLALTLTRLATVKSR